jgi:hypothetical protein
MSFLKSKRESGSLLERDRERDILNASSEFDNEIGLKSRRNPPVQRKRSKLVDMNDLIEEITREFEKEKKEGKQSKNGHVERGGYNNKLASPSSNSKNSNYKLPILPGNSHNITPSIIEKINYTDIDSYLERSEKYQKNEVKKIKRSAPNNVLGPMINKQSISTVSNSLIFPSSPPVITTKPNKIEFIKSREIQFSFSNFQKLTLKFKNMKAKVKADFLVSSIHKPDIINIKEFSSEGLKQKFMDYLMKLKLGPLAQFLAENIITCFTLYTDDLTMKDRETLDSYYKIIYSFQFDSKFAILENSLAEDKFLIMIESSKFPFSSCLPDFEFFIISVNKSLFQVKNEIKIEKSVHSFTIDSKESKEFGDTKEIREKSLASTEEISMSKHSEGSAISQKVFMNDNNNLEKEN